MKKFKRIEGCDLFVKDWIYDAIEIEGDYYCKSDNGEILSNASNKKYWKDLEGDRGSDKELDNFVKLFRKSLDNGLIKINLEVEDIGSRGYNILKVTVGLSCGTFEDESDIYETASVTIGE